MRTKVEDLVEDYLEGYFDPKELEKELKLAKKAALEDMKSNNSTKPKQNAKKS